MTKTSLRQLLGNWSSPRLPASPLSAMEQQGTPNRELVQLHVLEIGGFNLPHRWGLDKIPHANLVLSRLDSVIFTRWEYCLLTPIGELFYLGKFRHLKERKPTAVPR